MKNKLIITAALVGNGTTKAMNPAVPYTAEEIAKDAVLCARAGAAIIHIHVREADGRPTMSTQLFADAYNATKDALAEAGLDAIINLSTGGAASDEQRCAHIKLLKPEMCSYNPGSINWGPTVYVNSPQYMEILGKMCQETGTKPELEIFDTHMFNLVANAVKTGTLKEPCHYQFIMGIPGGMTGTVKNISFLMDMLPENATWSITGVSKYHMPAILTGLAGGANGIRVGLEDGVWLDRGVPATNELFVKQAVELGKAACREIATAEEARQILGVKHRD